MKLNLKEYISLLKKYLKQQWVGLVLLFISMFSMVGVELLRPSVLGKFIDNIKTDLPIRSLYLMAVLYLFLTLAKQGLLILMVYLTQNIGWKSTNQLRIDLSEHCLNLDMKFHKNFTPGQLVERVDGDISVLFQFFTTFITSILKSVILIVVLISYMAYISPKYAIIYVVYLSLAYLYNIVFAKKINKVSEISRQEESNLYGLIGEHITSVEDIRALGAKEYVLNKERKVLRKLYNAMKVDWLLGFGDWSYQEFISIFSRVISFIVVGVEVYSANISLGTAYLLFSLSDLLIEPLVGLKEEILYMQKTDASIRRINELLNYEREISKGEVNFNDDKLNLEFKNVKFGYEDKVVIDDVNFCLEKGKVLGILGRTGSGKTTLARLTSKLYDTDSGEILINGVDIKNLSDDFIRSNISFVTQEVQIFNGTIRDNLTIFDESIKDEEIMNIIEDIGIYDWFEKLSDGLDTPISTENPGLSSGELQLLTFLRVFLKNPKLIILDEATSRLDPITEKYLERAMESLVKNRTVIIIAHKLKTVLKADEILILEDGKVVENDSTTKLKMDKKSRFSILLEKGLEEVLV